MIDRAESLHSRLHDAHLDGAVVALPQHVYYFTGHRPGAILRRCIADAGYGDHIAHHADHGLRLLHPERPYIAPWDEMELTERMVLSIEPGIYISGLGGMRNEQNFIVWADGAEPTSQFPPQLSASG